MQSLKLFGLEPKRSNSDIVGMMKREMCIVGAPHPSGVGAAGGGGGETINHT